MPCFNCTIAGQCLLKNFVVLEKSDLNNRALIASAEATVYYYMLANDVTPTEAPEFLANEYQRLVVANDNYKTRVNVIDRMGKAVQLDTGLLDPPDQLIPTDVSCDETDEDLGKRWLERQRSFFRRKFFSSPNPYIVPYVHPRNADIWLLTVNVVGARLSKISRLWPRTPADNDNFPDFFAPCNDN